MVCRRGPKVKRPMSNPPVPAAKIKAAPSNQPKSNDFGCFGQQNISVAFQSSDFGCWAKESSTRAACLTVIKQYSFVYQNCSLGKDSLFPCKSVSEENIGVACFRFVTKAAIFVALVSKTALL